ncbi:hypothetical protein [Rugamonas aquatica]|uniref:Uncharacterized protein n=1 Tax=Rugamonas aquatica TaxID=2743357 RepID=A0A6A7MWK9_9BURK|nr:hypothetical protein [Rugamonas aquatica]MQA37038.1 hypothetical protein [Rugamonas aquatica]
MAAYLCGCLPTLSTLFKPTALNVKEMRCRIHALRQQLPAVADAHLRATADALLSCLQAQLDLPHPSGAGPSGAGMGGVRAAADGLIRVFLERDTQLPCLADYLDAVHELVNFEALRWWGHDFNVMVRRECLNAAQQLRTALARLQQAWPEFSGRVNAILAALREYQMLFDVEGLGSDSFSVYWPVLGAWDAIAGPVRAPGFPACLRACYQLQESPREIAALAQAWLEQELPLAQNVARKIAALPFAAGAGSLQAVWCRVNTHYAVDCHAWMARVTRACDDYGARYLAIRDPGALFGDDAWRCPPAPRQTSMFAMINAMARGAARGQRLAISPRLAASPLLGLQTALAVPMSEGMAFCLEFEYWDAARQLLAVAAPDPVQAAYLSLYGAIPETQAEGVLCAQLETYIRRLIRYVRALCDVRVHNGEMTYTEFIAWAAGTTGLSMETLHNECFGLMASPGRAASHAVGAAAYALLRQQNQARGVSAQAFHTAASRQRVYPWPIGKALLAQGATFQSGAG